MYKHNACARIFDRRRPLNLRVDVWDSDLAWMEELGAIRTCILVLEYSGYRCNTCPRIADNQRPLNLCVAVCKLHLVRIERGWLLSTYLFLS